MDNQGKAVLVVGGVLVVGAGAGIYFLTKGKKASLVGAVVSGVDGTAIAGAAVSVEGKNAVTDSVGMFTILDLPIGEVSVSITATGFIPYTTPLSIVEGANPKTFQLFKTVTQAGLSGLVTDQNTGAPLAGVQVAVSGKSATTVADGTYSLSGLVAGLVSVVFTLAGYKQRTISATLVAGANTLNATMNNRGTIQGTVRDSVTSVPIAGATVTAGTLTATTNANGGYSFTMPSGPKNVTASKAGYQTQTQAITVDPEITKPLDFSLVQVFAQEGTVQGTVMAGSINNPITGAQIIFTGPDNVPHEVMSGYLGAYSIDLPSNSVPGITYSIQAAASGYQSYSGSITVRTGTINTRNISLTPVAVQAGSLAGMVFNQAGQPVVGATVMLQDTSPLKQATTDQWGYYRITDVVPKSYVLFANAAGFAQQSKNVTVVSGQELAVPIFYLVPIQQAIGFFMVVDFDPTSWPGATVWWADINGTFINPFISVNNQWDGTAWNMDGVASQNLTVELYDVDFNRLVRRVVPLGGAAGPLVQNGHVYSFDVNQAHLYDLGTF